VVARVPPKDEAGVQFPLAAPVISPVLNLREVHFGPLSVFDGLCMKNAIHDADGLLLCPFDCVSVDPESGADIAMPEQLRHHLYWDTFRQEDAGRRVSQVMEAHSFEPRLFEQRLKAPGQYMAICRAACLMNSRKPIRTLSMPDQHGAAVPPG
jgi:hypothetical protein